MFRRICYRLCHYSTLGVPRDASSEEIRRAYYALVISHHQRALSCLLDENEPTTLPRNSTVTSISALEAAFEVLSNGNRRKSYDASLLHDAPPPLPYSKSPSSTTAKKYTEAPEGKPKRKTLTFHANLTYTLAQFCQHARRGDPFMVNLVDRPMLCGTCQGEGTKNAASKRICGVCLGNAYHECYSCDGTGFTVMIKGEDQCAECGGQGYRLETGVHPVEVDKIHPGQSLIYSGSGGCLPGLAPGDLHVQCIEKFHPNFWRRGNDLITKVSISLAEALRSEIFVPHVDGRIIRLRSDQGLGHGTVVKVPGEGIPNKGDLYVVLTLQMPSGEAVDSNTLREVVTILGGTAPPCPGAGLWNPWNPWNIDAEILGDETETSLHERLKATWSSEELGANAVEYPADATVVRISRVEYTALQSKSKPRHQKATPSPETTK